jgi:hypothetical protein
MHKQRFGNAVIEAFPTEPFWAPPVPRGRGLAAEGTLFLTDKPEAATRHDSSEDWTRYWGCSLSKETIFRPSRASSFEVFVFYAGYVAACSSAETWASLSLLSKHNTRSMRSISELVANFWQLPALTYRPHDESGATVEAQIARLERCAGTDTANRVQSELEHQIAAAEEEPVTVPVPALRRLVDFMCAHPRVRAPYVFITGEKIKAQWQPSSDRIAWIEFDATEQVTLLAFWPDPRALGGVKRFVGHSTVQDAYLELRRLGVDWMVR